MPGTIRSHTFKKSSAKQKAIGLRIPDRPFTHMTLQREQGHGAQVFRIVRNGDGFLWRPASRNRGCWRTDGNAFRCRRFCKAAGMRKAWLASSNFNEAEPMRFANNGVARGSSKFFGDGLGTSCASDFRHGWGVGVACTVKKVGSEKSGLSRLRELTPFDSAQGAFTRWLSGVEALR